MKQVLVDQQYDLSSAGKQFLLREAHQAFFFMLGELHGENEIPHLLQELWPPMWQDGYRHIAAELSPWAANQLEFTPAPDQPPLLSLWTKKEASFVHASSSSQPVLWGCDMEEGQPQLLIRDLAVANPGNPAVARMLTITKSGYDRKMTSDLLQLTENLQVAHDPIVNDIPLLKEINSTLDIDRNRLDPDSKLTASTRRESLMKDLFLQHFMASDGAGAVAKVMLRFGRNHLHRGYDDRGVSTLGNFVAEFAVARHQVAFNVAAFGAGGKASLAGETWDADERNDDLAFAFLASLAHFPATVFDLRPLRRILHRIPEERRSSLDLRLIYWADSYDAIICYKNVTPLAQATQ